MTGNDSLPSVFFVFQRYPGMIPSKYKLFLMLRHAHVELVWV